MDYEALHAHPDLHVYLLVTLPLGSAPMQDMPELPIERGQLGTGSGDEHGLGVPAEEVL
jgi:hypothetical protein